MIPSPPLSKEYGKGGDHDQQGGRITSQDSGWSGGTPQQHSTHEQDAQDRIEEVYRAKKRKAEPELTIELEGAQEK